MRFFLIKSNALLLWRRLNQPNVAGNQEKNKHLGQKRSFNKKITQHKHAIYKDVKQRHNCCRVQSPFDCVTPSLSFQWKSKQLDLKQDLRDGNRRGVYKKGRLVKVWTLIPPAPQAGTCFLTSSANWGSASDNTDCRCSNCSRGGEVQGDRFIFQKEVAMASKKGLKINLKGSRREKH